MPVPIKEVDFPAENWKPYWLDDSQVLFRGFTGVEPDPTPQIGQGKKVRLLNQGYYVWNIEQGKVTRDARFDHAHPECINGQTKSYVLRYSSDGKPSQRQAFIGDQEMALPDQVWVNPVSCRASTTKPAWAVANDNGREVVPLLEEHGYVDRGIRSKRTEVFPVFYYPFGAESPISLRMDTRQVEKRMAYAPFLNAYVLEGSRGRITAPPLWLLHPNGTVEQIFSPEGKAWAEQSWSWVVLTKRGPVFGKITYRGDQVRDSGLYLWENGTLTKLLSGVVSDRAAVSPDGCNLAFVFSRIERPLPGGQLFRLQLIDLCQGGNDGH